MGYALPIDTLKFAKRLEKSGIPRKQAEVFADAITDSYKTADLATKKDVQTAVTEAKNTLDNRIIDVKNELSMDIKIVAKDVKKLEWMLGVVIAGMLALLIKSFT